MREETLRDFLLGEQSAGALNREAADTTIHRGARLDIRAASIGSWEHVVTPAQLTRLCDAVHEGTIDPVNLETIAFTLIASDFFVWDRETPHGERVATVLHDWAAPEINYPLNPSNVSKARHYLITGQNAFTPDDVLARPESS